MDSGVDKGLITMMGISAVNRSLAVEEENDCTEDEGLYSRMNTGVGNRRNHEEGIFKELESVSAEMLIGESLIICLQLANVVELTCNCISLPTVKRENLYVLSIESERLPFAKQKRMDVREVRSPGPLSLKTHRIRILFVKISMKRVQYEPRTRM